MGEGSLRNRLCWCGSGKKYKRCHAGREEEPTATTQEMLDDLKSLDQRTCLHPYGRKNCDGPVIRAHTVAKSGSLASIAEGGHVYGWDHDFVTMSRNEGNFGLKLLGINRASTFTGFCKSHDQSIFAPIERQPLTFSPEQLFLLGYRAVCFEYYKKVGALVLAQLLRDKDRGRKPAAQRSFQEWLDLVEQGDRAGLNDLEHHKAAYDTRLLSSDFEEVRGYVIRLERPPSVLCSAAMFPEFDFEGRILQEMGDLSKPLELICVSSIAVEENGAVAFTWLSGQRTSLLLCESLERVPIERISSALIRLMFQFSENIYLTPSWWNSLSKEVQVSLVRRLNTGMVGGEDHSTGCLMEDNMTPSPWRVVDRVWIGGGG
jgi:hypothetical protein